MIMQVQQLLNHSCAFFVLIADVYDEFGNQTNHKKLINLVSTELSFVVFWHTVTAKEVGSHSHRV